MESGGAETEIKAGFWQCSFFKGGSQDCQGLIWKCAPEEACEATVGLDGNQRISTPLKQSTGCCSRSGSDLKCNRIRRKTTSIA